MEAQMTKETGVMWSQGKKGQPLDAGGGKESILP